MQNYITKSEADVEKATTPKKTFYNFGEIHPHLLGEWDENYSKTDKINIMISYIGKYELPRSTFGKYKCPVCGKVELEIYDCSASVLSGANVLRGICKNCNELIAFNDDDIYHEIKDYLLNNEVKNDGGMPEIVTNLEDIKDKNKRLIPAEANHDIIDIL